jgi:hypothetical protein
MYAGCNPSGFFIQLLSVLRFFCNLATDLEWGMLNCCVSSREQAVNFDKVRRDTASNPTQKEAFGLVLVYQLPC